MTNNCEMVAGAIVETRGPSVESSPSLSLVVGMSGFLLCVLFFLTDRDESSDSQMCESGLRETSAVIDGSVDEDNASYQCRKR